MTMTKKCLSLLLAICLLASFAFVPNFQPNTAFAQNFSYIVMEKSSGRILEGSNIHDKMEIASTTKILTALTVIDKIENLNAIYKVPQEAIGIEGSSVFLNTDEEISVIELLYGLMLRSGTDCAVALAIITSGSVEKFSELMNKKAKSIGCINSHFVNPHGLPAKNSYSSAFDLALITKTALDNPTFREISSTKFYKGKNRTYENKNKLLSSLPGATGVKTGYTKSAGRCLVSSCKRDDMEIISVCLNCPDMWNVSTRNIENAFSSFELVELVPQGEVQKLPISGMLGKKTSVGLFKPLKVPVKKDGSEKVELKTNLAQNLYFPIKKGTICGEFSVFIENRLIFVEKIYTMNEVNINNLFF